MPKGQVLFMDVKFPMSAYLRYLDATTDAERATHRATFLRDVRLRVRELARREYASADSRAAVDNVLLFVPNETLSAFIHENDPALIDEAMRQRVVICSPLTLFAFLGIIRQAFDNYVMEQTSHEMMQLLGKFAQQWGKYSESIDKVKRQFDTVQRSFDELATTRKRALERPLKDLEALRLDRGVAVDGELFAAEVLELEGYRERRCVRHWHGSRTSRPQSPVIGSAVAGHRAGAGHRLKRAREPGTRPSTDHCPRSRSHRRALRPSRGRWRGPTRRRRIGGSGWGRRE